MARRAASIAPFLDLLGPAGLDVKLAGLWGAAGEGNFCMLSAALSSVSRAGLAERGITVGHVTGYRRVQRFTPEFVGAARFCRHAPGYRWSADETYVKIAGQWACLCRAIDSTARSSTCCYLRGES